MRLGRTAVRLAVLFVVAVVIVLAPGAGAEDTDLFPPGVEIIAPPADGVVSEARPAIRLSFSDAASGIDPATLRLALDRLDVTSSAEVETSIDGAWHLTYLPPLALSPGPHEAWFQVSDRAGNVATVTWGFRIVRPSPAAETHLGGTSVVGVSLLPLAQVTGTLDLRASATSRPAAAGGVTLDVRMKAAGETGFVGLGEPLGPFAGRLQEYAVDLQRGDVELALGAVLVNPPSQILTTGLVSDGTLLSVQLPGPPTCRSNLSAFRGRSLASQGFGLAVVDFQGGAARIVLPQGMQVSAVRAEAWQAATPSWVNTLRTEFAPGPRGAAPVAVEVARSEDERRAPGYAFLVEGAGRSPRSTLSLAWWRADAAFATSLLQPEFTGSGGVQRVRLRGNYAFKWPVVASLDAVSLRDQLDVPGGLSNAADEAVLRLQCVPPGDWAYSAAYRLERRVDPEGSDSPGPGPASSELEAAVDFRGKPGERPTYGRARLTRSFSGGGQTRGGLAGITLSRDYRTVTWESSVEHSTRREPFSPIQTTSSRLGLSLVPRFSLALGPLKPVVSGRITAGWSREARRDQSLGAFVSRQTVMTLKAVLAVDVTPKDTLSVLAERRWSDLSDTQLRCEYRRRY